VSPPTGASITDTLWDWMNEETFTLKTNTNASGEVISQAMRVISQALGVISQIFRVFFQAMRE
jgi:hypothetical protein